MVRTLSALRHWISPVAKMHRSFRAAFGRELDLSNPKTFNEKIYRLKLDRDPRMVAAIDKVRVKHVVAAELGPDWIVPTLWHGTVLPPRSERNWPIPYVVKANNGSGWNHFVRTPEDQNWRVIERKCAKWLRSRYDVRHQEMAYGDIPPQILVEPFLGNGDIVDYKIFVFGGRAEFISADFNLDGKRQGIFYDRDWRRQPFERWPPSPALDLQPPKHLRTLCEAAEQLARGLRFVRVDLYEIDGRPYFGEMTFHPGAGNIPFNPPEYDAIVGALWPD
jgi:hypothetical protein